MALGRLITWFAQRNSESESNQRSPVEGDRYRSVEDLQQLVDDRRLLYLRAVAGRVDDGPPRPGYLVGDLLCPAGGRSLSHPPSTTSVGTEIRS